GLERLFHQIVTNTKGDYKASAHVPKALQVVPIAYAALSVNEGLIELIKKQRLIESTKAYTNIAAKGWLRILAETLNLTAHPAVTLDMFLRTIVGVKKDAKPNLFADQVSSV
ncbi:unnamed protein product, partial [Discosporangium mesarthrocarpum]